MQVAVLGAGSWGTALASLLARNGHRTVLWGRDAGQVLTINEKHENTRYCFTRTARRQYRSACQRA